MRNVAELTELEAQFVTSLITAYPDGMGYTTERDQAVRGFAAELIDEGRVERIAITEPGAAGFTYRLTDTFAEQVRDVSSNRAAGAHLN